MENSPDVVFVNIYMAYNDNVVDFYDEFEVIVGAMQGLIDKNVRCNRNNTLLLR